jgi:hypothetical protein
LEAAVLAPGNVPRLPAVKLWCDDMGRKWLAPPAAGRENEAADPWLPVPALEALVRGWVCGCTGRWCDEASGARWKPEGTRENWYPVELVKLDPPA